MEADLQARNVVAEAPAPEAEAILPLAGRDALELPDGVGAAAANDAVILYDAVSVCAARREAPPEVPLRAGPCRPRVGDGSGG